MKIETTRFGTLDVEEGKIIYMPYGMLGFPASRRFALFRHKEDSPFFWFQSVDDPALAFVITLPSLVADDYKPDTKDSFRMMAWKDCEHQSGCELYVVVNIPKGAPEKMTANLAGPILINNKAREAVQLVLADSPYSHRHPLLANGARHTSHDAGCAEKK